MDQKHCGTPAGQQGRVEAKYLSFGEVKGLCFGAFGEASEQVHLFIEHAARQRVRQGPVYGKRRGTPLKSPAAKAMMIGQIRRELSVVVHRAQARLLLANIWQVGEGTATAVERRERAEGRESGWRREMWASHERSFAFRFYR